MKKSPLSRKDFLKLTWTSLWGLVLAACKIETEEIPTATQTQTATNTPTPTSTSTATPTNTPTPTATSTNTPIPCFSLISPEDKADLIVIGRQEFKWEEQFGATSYELEIIIPTYPEGTPVLFKTENLSFAIYLENFRWGGEYLWKVTAFNEKKGVICMAEFYRFTKAESPKQPEKKQDEGDGNSGGDDDGGLQLDPGEQWDQ